MEIPNEISIETVRELVLKGWRVLLMMRHAEREHISPDDPTFGAALPITPAGRAAALALGRRLAGLEVQFLSSPLNRTRLTACAVAEGMGLADVWNAGTIPVDGRLGNESFYFADRMAVWGLFRKGDFYPEVFRYIRDGRNTGFNDLREASDRLEEFVLSRFTAPLGVFTTHDLYNGAFLSAKGARPQGWTVESWVRFLDSAAILVDPAGRRHYALARNLPLPQSQTSPQP